MSGILVYISGHHDGNPPADNKDAAILLRGGKGSWTPATTGPDQKSGMIWAPKIIETTVDYNGDEFIPKEPKVGYRPDQQTWLKLGTCWVGWEKENPPHPCELQWRPLEDIRHVALLGDGNKWGVPCVHPGNHTSLPDEYEIDNDGIVIARKPPTEYEAICRESEVWHTKCVNDENVGMTEAIPYCVALLQLNYRVTPRMVGFDGLGLLKAARFIANTVLLSLGGAAYAQELEAKKKAVTPLVG